MAKTDISTMTFQELQAMQLQISVALRHRRIQDLEQLKSEVLALLATSGFTLGEFLPVLAPKLVKARSKPLATAPLPTGSDAPVAPANTRAKAPVKYRKADDSWTGRGQQPKWVREHIAAGGTLADLAV